MVIAMASGNDIGVRISNGWRLVGMTDLYNANASAWAILLPRMSRSTQALCGSGSVASRNTISRTVLPQLAVRRYRLTSQLVDPGLQYCCAIHALPPLAVHFSDAPFDRPHAAFWRCAPETPAAFARAPAVRVRVDFRARFHMGMRSRQ